jgi:hypothetical protein
MRLKWTALMILIGFCAVACATETGPRFNSMLGTDQQRIQQELENNADQYFIHFIPEHAVLFDPKDDNNTLKVSGRWIRVGEAEEKRWIEILRQNTNTADNVISIWLGASTGFLEIIGPDEQFFGYLVHEKDDLVSLKIIDRNTMRIFYSPRRTEGP